jgi:hypothetical protein
MTDRITTASGLIVLVDDGDFALVEQYKWYADRRTYTTYVTGGIDGARVYLHRFIMCPAQGIEVDHINRNGLDNRRANLRLCTHSQNMANARMRTGTGYRGAYADPANNRFRAEIKVDGRRIRLGSFRTAEAAARAYDEAAADAFGEFATLNFPRHSMAA